MKRILTGLLLLALPLVMLAGCKQDMPQMKQTSLEGTYADCMGQSPVVTLNLDGSSSSSTDLVFGEEKPYWGMAVVNKGEARINVEVGGQVVRLEAHESAWIYVEEPDGAGLRRLSFSTDPGSEMEGSVQAWTAGEAEAVAPSEG